MINHIELLEPIFHFIQTHNSWDEFSDWYQEKDETIKNLLWFYHTPFMLERAIIHQRLDFLEFVLKNSLDLAVHYLEHTHFVLLDWILENQNTSLFDLLFNHLHPLLQDKVKDYFFIKASNALDTNDEVLFIKIINLSKRSLLDILLKYDNELIESAIDNASDAIIQEIFLNFEQELYSILSNQEYRLLHLLVRSGHIKTIQYLFELMPEHQEKFIKSQDYMMFQMAAEFNHLNILKYLVEQRPDLKLEMIEANQYDSFLRSRYFGHQNISDTILSDLLACGQQVTEMLCQNDFSAIHYMLCSHTQDFIKTCIDLISEEMIKKAKKEYRCEIFESAVKNFHYPLALDLLKMYRQEKINILPSLISVFQNSDEMIDSELFKEIIADFNDEIIMDVLGSNQFESLIHHYDASHLKQVDMIFGHLREVKNYRTCLNVLKNSEAGHSEYLDTHFLLASIQDFIQSLGGKTFKKIIPGFKKFLTLYPVEQHEAVAYYLNIYIKNLKFIQKDFFSKLEDLKPLIDLLLENGDQCIGYYQFLYLNFSILELLARSKILSQPLMLIKKWQEYHAFMTCFIASLNRNHLKITRHIQLDIFEENLNKEMKEILANSLCIIHKDYQSQFSLEQLAKLECLIICLRADKDLFGLFLHTEIPEVFQNKTWVSYQTIFNLAEEILFTEEHLTAEYQLLAELTSQRDFHPITLEFFTILPTFCSKLEEKFQTKEICVFENLLIDREPKLNFSPIPMAQMEQAKSWYQIRYESLNFDYSSHIKLVYLEEIIKLINAETIQNEYIAHQP